MPDIIKKDWRGKIVVILFLLLTVWWLLSPSYQGTERSRFFGDFPSIYAIVALLGSLWGFTISQKWGGFKSVMGKAIIFLSMGLFAQVFGQVVYAYYSFYERIAIPYPSWGDLGYFGSIPLYAIGVLFLAQAAGVKFTLKSYASKLQSVFIPLVALIFSYSIFLRGYQFDVTAPLKTFLDFGYPLGEVIYLSLALLSYILSRKILGGVMRYKILNLLLALSIQYLCDFTFLYQVSKGSYISGGINDYMYLISYLAMTLGLLELDIRWVRKILENK